MGSSASSPYSLLGLSGVVVESSLYALGHRLRAEVELGDPYLELMQLRLPMKMEYSLFQAERH
jgi:hypothetical protein